MLLSIAFRRLSIIILVCRWIYCLYLNRTYIVINIKVKESLYFLWTTLFYKPNPLIPVSFYKTKTIWNKTKTRWEIKTQRALLDQIFQCFFSFFFCLLYCSTALPWFPGKYYPKQCYLKQMVAFKPFSFTGLRLIKRREKRERFYV